MAFSSQAFFEDKNINLPPILDSSFPQVSADCHHFSDELWQIQKAYAAGKTCRLGRTFWPILCLKVQTCKQVSCKGAASLIFG